MKGGGDIVVDEILLDVKNLRVDFLGVPTVRDVNFKIYGRETLGIIGESGSGKTTLARAIMRILSEDGTISQNSSAIYYGIGNREVDILKLSLTEYSKLIRWKELSMVFQSALNSLNPTLRVRDHFIETAKAHGLSDSSKIMERARELLEAVKLDPDSVLKMFTVELSGGMKQRVVIALALLLNPKILILDEPTTALDVLTQRAILDLLKKLREIFNLTYVLITHDIALVADLSDRVAVIYAGKIVEEGGVEDIFYNPLHPYTKLLLEAVPKLGEFDKLPKPIPGASIDYRNLPSGCSFHPRCPYASNICILKEPSLTNIEKNRRVACHIYTSSWRA
ncbi:MAG: ABC transporter ATP-binding protein [Candidatus Bathyarchaeia archaeon]